MLTEAGQVPATAAGHRLFVSARLVRLARGDRQARRPAQSLSLGAYLGAVQSLQTPLYRDQAARAAASEAQHLSVFTAAVGGRRLGSPLPAALPLAKVSDTLDEYTS